MDFPLASMPTAEESAAHASPIDDAPLNCRRPVEAEMTVRLGGPALMTAARAIRSPALILLLALAPVTVLAQSDVWERHIRAGISAYQQQHYDEAEEQYQAALNAAIPLGQGDPAFAITLGNLSELKRIQGHIAEAESLAQHSSTLMEKALGPEHPNVATALNNLADLSGPTQIRRSRALVQTVSGDQGEDTGARAS